MTIDVRPPTETEMTAYKRRAAFHESIAAKAAELKASKLRTAVERLPAPGRAAGAIAPEAMPAEVDPPKTQYWFWITGLVPNTLSIAAVKHAVCFEFGVKYEDLAGPRRQVEIVIPRQIAMWLCKDLIPSKSFPQIGREFGHRDHTTALHACQAAPKKVAACEKLAERVARIRAELSVAL